MAKKQGIVNINHNRCKACGICVSVCPVQNYKIEHGKLREFGKCIACLQCERYCPDMALIIDTKND
ncbi:MAG: 4Fe-4S binding protein [Candidatus Scalindua rubra]|nr:4Fe-4S binding protein [Candidatus Scalindua rubra]